MSIYIFSAPTTNLSFKIGVMMEKCKCWGSSDLKFSSNSRFALNLEPFFFLPSPCHWTILCTEIVKLWSAGNHKLHLRHLTIGMVEVAASLLRAPHHKYKFQDIIINHVFDCSEHKFSIVNQHWCSSSEFNFVAVNYDIKIA